MKKRMFCDTMEEAEKKVEELERSKKVGLIWLSKHNLLVSWTEYDDNEI